LHLVGILFPHINDDAQSKSHQICTVFAHVTCGLQLLTLLLSPLCFKKHGGNERSVSEQGLCTSHVTQRGRQNQLAKGSMCIILPCHLCQKTVLLWCVMLPDQDVSC